MKKYLSLFIFLIAVVALVVTGCGGTHGYGTDAAGEPLNAVERTVADGKVSAEIGGFKFDFAEGNMKDGIVVTLRQLEATEPSKEAELVGSSYIYDLKAVLKKSGALESDVTVITLEKAANITIQNDIPGADSYMLAMKNEGDTDWSYSLINEDNETNPLFVASARLSSALASLPEFKIRTYNVNRQFRLFAYKATEESKKTIIASAKLATNEQEIKVAKGSIFNEDLPVELKLAGVNSDSLTAADFKVKIHYQSDSVTSQNIPIDGSAATYEHSANGAGSGNKYANTISFKPLQTNFSNSAGIISIKFLINLKGFSPLEFAESFTVEVINASDKALPFSYADNCRLTLKEASDPETQYLTVVSTDPAADATDVAVDKSIVITFSNPVTVEAYLSPGCLFDAESNSVDCNHQLDSTGTILTLTLKSPLENNHKYNVNISKDSLYAAADREIKLKEDIKFSFTTVAKSEPSITELTVVSTDPSADATDVAVDKSIVITFSTPVTVEDYISSSLFDAESNLVECDYMLDSTATILTLTPKSPLKNNHNYKLNVSKSSLYATADRAIKLKEDIKFSFTTVAESKYTLTVLKGTGIATASEGGSYSAGEVITLECAPEAGYQFVSWTSDEVIVSEDNKFTMPAKDVTVTANASVIAYEFRYDGLDGATLGDGVTNPESYDITSATITLNNPTKTDYAFIGWTGTGIEEGTASMTVTIPQGSMGDRNYVASWAPAVLTFNLSDTVTLEMRRCPAGTFVRQKATVEGLEEYGGDGLEVTISKDFYMGTYEVTNAQYVAIMGGPSPSSSIGEKFTGDKQPVVNVIWNDITADSTGFIAKMNSKFASQLPYGYKFALPTEAQWEYACRAGTETDLNNNKNIENGYSPDDNTNEVAWYWYNWGESYESTHDVGGKSPNSFGLYDMHGNVWEWCADWFSDYDGSNLKDPTGPAEPDRYYNFLRVLRGGSWYYDPSNCASWFRYFNSPDSECGSDCGFRLALVKVE